VTRLRLVSYNVAGLRGDQAALAAVVRSLRPDVMVVQEAPRRLRWRSRCADLARRVDLVYAAGGLPGLGNLLLVDLGVQVHDTWCLRYPLTPGRHMRGAALARCSMAGSTFVVAGTHLATDPAERPGQADVLARALAEVQVPIILAGDVNEEPGGEAWATLADGRVDAASAAAAASASASAEAAAEAATFPASGPAQRLDAIFVDRRLTVTGCRVVDTPEARRASDHLPVVADITLGDPG
jgi:endonuclease/exonuclease/phosphatase family metal-dependent hydrolase